MFPCVLYSYLMTRQNFYDSEHIISTSSSFSLLECNFFDLCLIFKVDMTTICRLTMLILLFLRINSKLCRQFFCVALLPFEKTEQNLMNLSTGSFYKVIYLIFRLFIFLRFYFSYVNPQYLRNLYEIMVLKPGKDHTEVESYLLTALSLIVSKLFEELTLNRLKVFIEMFQHMASRNRHLTIDQVHI